MSREILVWNNQTEQFNKLFIHLTFRRITTALGECQSIPEKTVRPSAND